MKCGINTSFMVLGRAHKKNKLVTNANVSRYPGKMNDFLVLMAKFRSVSTY